MTFPPQSLDVLSEFYWLKTHAGCMLKGCKDADPSTEVCGNYFIYLFYLFIYLTILFYFIYLFLLSNPRL